MFMYRTVVAVLLAVPVGLLLFPIVVMALCLRFFSFCVRTVARAFEPGHVPWPELMRFDPELGWKPRPNLNSHYLAERDDVFHIMTDADGWPGRSSLEESKVVAIGDSFVFGYGIDIEKSFTELEAKMRIKAIGAPGYSMVHGVLLMEQLGERLKDKVVLWFPFMENDLVDGLMPNHRRYRAPFLRWDKERNCWEITTHHIRSQPWDCSLFRRRHPVFGRLHVPNALSEHIYSGCGYLIGRAASICREAGATLAVVTIPHRIELEPGLVMLRKFSGDEKAFEPGLPDRRIREYCCRLGLPFLSGAEFLKFSDYKPREGIHWTGRGHLKMAEHLGRFLSQIEGLKSGREISGQALPTENELQPIREARA
jgi:hypothetical protein